MHVLLFKCIHANRCCYIGQHININVATYENVDEIEIDEVVEEEWEEVDTEEEMVEEGEEEESENEYEIVAIPLWKTTPSERFIFALHEFYRLERKREELAGRLRELQNILRIPYVDKSRVRAKMSEVRREIERISKEMKKHAIIVYESCERKHFNKCMRCPHARVCLIILRHRAQHRPPQRAEVCHSYLRTEHG